jgi:hypothetical protein
MRRTNGFVKEPCLRPAEGRYAPTAVLQALPSIQLPLFTEARRRGILGSSAVLAPPATMGAITPMGSVGKGVTSHAY